MSSNNIQTLSQSVIDQNGNRRSLTNQSNFDVNRSGRNVDARLLQQIQRLSHRDKLALSEMLENGDGEALKQYLGVGSSSLGGGGGGGLNSNMLLQSQPGGSSFNTFAIRDEQPVVDPLTGQLTYPSHLGVSSNQFQQSQGSLINTPLQYQPFNTATATATSLPSGQSFNNGGTGNRPLPLNISGFQSGGNSSVGRRPLSVPMSPSLQQQQQQHHHQQSIVGPNSQKFGTNAFTNGNNNSHHQQHQQILSSFGRSNVGNTGFRQGQNPLTNSLSLSDNDAIANYLSQ
jgi:hypothetical protein